MIDRTQPVNAPEIWRTRIPPRTTRYLKEGEERFGKGPKVFVVLDTKELSRHDGVQRRDLPRTSTRNKKKSSVAYEHPRQLHGLNH